MNEQSSGKDALLEGLKIDRKTGATHGGIILPVTLSFIIGGLLVGGILFATGRDESGDQPQSSNSATVEAEVATPAEEPASTAATPVRASQATSDDGIVLNASGYITARRVATVSAQQTGLILEVLVEEGMAVTKGQVVARLDDTLVRVDLELAVAQVTASEADVATNRASLSEAERVLARREGIRIEDFISEAELTRARANVESFTARLARAEADLEIARLKVNRQEELLDDYIIRAPFDGVVINKAAQPGEIVSPISAGGGFTRTGICTVVDMDSLEIEVDVNEAFIGRVFAGQRVNATLDAYPDWTIPSSVIAIVPTANRDKATVRVRLAIEVSDPRILPDMGIKVAFLGSS